MLGMTYRLEIIECALPYRAVLLELIAVVIVVMSKYKYENIYNIFSEIAH